MNNDFTNVYIKFISNFVTSVNSANYRFRIRAKYCSYFGSEDSTFILLDELIYKCYLTENQEIKDKQTIINKLKKIVKTEGILNPDSIHYKDDDLDFEKTVLNYRIIANTELIFR